MNIKARYLLILAVLFWALTVSAAAQENPPKAKTGESLTVTDMAGRAVTLDRPARRIVTTFKPATLCVFCLGLENHLVGIDTESAQDKLQRAVFPGVSEITVVGKKSTGLNLSTLAALKPDLVILYAQKDGLRLAERLATMDICSVVILPESFASIQESLRVIAGAMGKAKRTGRIVSLMEDILRRVDRRVADIAAKDRKKAYFASPRGLFSTATGNMLQHEIFARAGLINVSRHLSGYFQDISPEQFIRWHPDIVVLSQSLDPRVLERLENPAFDRIPAVSEKAIYRFPCSLAPWDFPSPLSVLGSLWLAEKAYPEKFSDTDVKAVINRFHKNLFGQTLSEMGGKLNDHPYAAR